MFLQTDNLSYKFIMQNFKIFKKYYNALWILFGHMTGKKKVILTAQRKPPGVQSFIITTGLIQSIFNIYWKFGFETARLFFQIRRNKNMSKAKKTKSTNMFVLLQIL